MEQLDLIRIPSFLVEVKGWGGKVREDSPKLTIIALEADVGTSLLRSGIGRWICEALVTISLAALLDPIPIVVSPPVSKV
jgi:hypothetical protein